MIFAGVHLKGGQMLDADLVVDASGKQSDVSKWLEQLGHKPPSTMTVEAGLQYTCRMYEMPEDPDRKWSIAVCIDNPEYNRAAVMVPIETNKWQVQPVGKRLPKSIYTLMSFDNTAEACMPFAFIVTCAVACSAPHLVTHEHFLIVMFLTSAFVGTTVMRHPLQFATAKKLH